MTWAPDYLALAAAKGFLRITDSEDDTELGIYITATSRAIDTRCHRQFGQVAAAETRYYTPVYDRTIRRWVIHIDDLMTTDDLTAEIQEEDGTTVGALDAYTLWPRNAAAIGRPWTMMVIRSDTSTTPTGAPGEAALAGIWGWSAVPAGITEASYLQLSRFAYRRASPHGIAGSPDMGSETRLLARLDPDVIVATGPFVRMGELPR